MTCPRNKLGQPACFIVAHPDHPNESFCITCGRRFSAPTESSSSTKSSLTTKDNHEFLVLLISILMLFLLLKAMLSQPNQGDLPSYEPPYNYRDLTEVQ